MNQVVQILVDLSPAPAPAQSTYQGRPDFKGKRVLVEEIEEEEEEEEGQTSLVWRRHTGHAGRVSGLPPVLEWEGETSRSRADQNRSTGLVLHEGEGVGKQTSIAESASRNTTRQGQAGGPLRLTEAGGEEEGRGQDEAAGGDTSSSEESRDKEGPDEAEEDEAAGGDTSSSEQTRDDRGPGTDETEEDEAGGGDTSSREHTRDEEGPDEDEGARSSNSKQSGDEEGADEDEAEGGDGDISSSHGGEMHLGPIN